VASDFTDLETWKLAHELMLDVYQFVKLLAPVWEIQACWPTRKVVIFNSCKYCRRIWKILLSREYIFLQESERISYGNEGSYYCC